MADNMSWQVQNVSCYSTFEMEFTQDTSLSVSLLIPLDSEHKTTGAFRLVVYGGEAEMVPVLAEDIIADLPDELKGLYMTLPCSSSRLRLPDNSTACQWADVEQLIRNVNLYTYHTFKIQHPILYLPRYQHTIRISIQSHPK